MAITITVWYSNYPPVKTNKLLWIKKMKKKKKKVEGTLLSALWWPKWEGNPKIKGSMYAYNRLTLMYNRN